jgi:NAD(P)-dependent dehydrogenase (short-subunit alcohol dehydrogenase family)
MCKKFLPLLLKSKDARIINVSSSAGKLSGERQVYYPAYSISKTSLNALTKVLAHEVSKEGIMVFSVDPGWVRTELGGEEAPYSIEEGIDTAVYLVTEERAKLMSGSFYFQRQVIDW